MIYEALIQLEDGRIGIGTVEAKDRDDAKWEFAHSPVVVIDGKQTSIKQVDYRTVKLSKEQSNA